MHATDISSTDGLLKINKTLIKNNIGLSVLIFVACLEENNLSLKEISEKLEITPSGMTTIRDCAENKKFVEKITDEDRRKKVYKITDKGIELLASFKQ